ncbi:MAG: PPE family protein [Actinomycetota bacterium]|uniref:PPE family protein n=1 Tax=Mycobacterium lentiflavum TaxID=141349 RepID=A0ABY3V0Y9_MYCLN|nr:PPE family protein [Mycobacterium lentiflavum]MEE3063747.1 PPE family protein [Actinomycetota bacterium]ULP43189.1 PPE family protein [Mycobacterium lentiflavum]
MVFGDFAVQPPELISGLLYAGPGSGSLLAAAAAWEALAAELHSTAASYAAVISDLVDESWAGPSSEAMAAAAAPYVTWMSTTAAQAEEAASRALAAARAYEAALAAAVPLGLIIENRVELEELLATNVLGQNNGEIAANQAEYAQMWAQDVEVMFSYASASESAGELTAFSEAPQTTAATAQAATAAAASPQSLSSWLTELESYINSLTGQYATFWQQLITGVTGSSDVAPMWEALYSAISSIGSQGTWTNVANASIGLGVSQWKNFFIYAPWSAAMAKSSLGAGLASPGHLAAVGAVRPVSAVLGGAPAVGSMSVPPSWATATPAIRLAATALPASVATAPAAEFPAGLINEATLGSLAGGALGSPVSRVVSATGIQARAITGERRVGPVKLDRVIAQLQEQPDQVQHWSVDEAGLDDLVARLTTTPGVHAVHVSDDVPAPAISTES